MPTGYRDATFYSRLGRVMTVIGALIGVLGVVGLFRASGPTAGIVGAVVVVALAVCLYAVLWRPRLDVREAGILVVNPFVSHHLDWSAIVSVEMRWALTIITATGPITVWAVPRPSRGADPLGMRTDAFRLPDYEAEKRHQNQDSSSRADNAAMRVIQSRLDGR